MGLNYNWSTMNSLVNSMTPNGNTNQPIGLVWGWMSLVGGGPFTAPAMDTNYKYNQIIILLTDGLNTQDRWYSNSKRRSITACTRPATAPAPAPISRPPASRSTRSRSIPAAIRPRRCCRTAPAVDTDPKGPKFFLLTSADQIMTTFQTIGTSLTKLGWRSSPAPPADKKSPASTSRAYRFTRANG